MTPVPTMNSLTIGVLAVALLLLVAALRWRSWPLWLGAFGVALVALWVIWYFRTPERTDPHTAGDIVSSTSGRLDRGHTLHASGLRLAESLPA